MRPSGGYGHFADRAKERGITSVCPIELWADLALAIQNDISEYVERVISVNDGSSLYRFRLPVEGICYVIARDGIPVTIATPEMVRDYKAARRSGSVRKWKQIVSERQHDDIKDSAINRMKRKRKT